MARNIPFGEVKHDIKAGYNYREYEAKVAGGEIVVVLDNFNECVLVDCTRWRETRGDEATDVESYRIMKFDVDEFINMSYKELSQHINYCLVY